MIIRMDKSTPMVEYIEQLQQQFKVIEQQHEYIQQQLKVIIQRQDEIQQQLEDIKQRQDEIQQAFSQKMDQFEQKYFGRVLNIEKRIR
jgi:septation ring formation regulator EzrA